MILFEKPMNYWFFRLDFFQFRPTFDTHQSIENMARNDLEDRLINFSVKCIELAESITKSYAGIKLSEQLISSSSSAALNYGEAQSAESSKDFIHKIKIVLKETRESHVNLRIVKGSKLTTKIELLDILIQEANELVSIFVASVNTAKANAEKTMKKKVV